VPACAALVVLDEEDPMRALSFACGLVWAGCQGTANPHVIEPDANVLPTSFSSDTVAAAAVTCDAPHGVIDTPAHADIEARVVGAWYLCSPPNVFFLSKPIEFNADHTYAVLLPDDAGGLTASVGLDQQGKWSLDDTADYIEPGPMLPEFEKQPLRMRLTVATSGFRNWYVPLVP
jgi:hypothetical protein